jgi:hypothetical protein
MAAFPVAGSGGTATAASMLISLASADLDSAHSSDPLCHQTPADHDTSPGVPATAASAFSGENLKFRYILIEQFVSHLHSI